MVLLPILYGRRLNAPRTGGLQGIDGGAGCSLHRDVGLALAMDSRKEQPFALEKPLWAHFRGVPTSLLVQSQRLAMAPPQQPIRLLGTTPYISLNRTGATYVRISLSRGCVTHSIVAIAPKRKVRGTCLVASVKIIRKP